MKNMMNVVEKGRKPFHEFRLIKLMITKLQAYILLISNEFIALFNTLFLHIQRCQVMPLS